MTKLMSDPQGAEKEQGNAEMNEGDDSEAKFVIDDVDLKSLENIF